MDEPSERLRGRGLHASQVLSWGATVLIVAVVVAVLALSNLYMPLTQGSAAAADALNPDSLFVRPLQDPFSSHSLWTYCSTPGGRFAWLLTLRNAGPLPVTVLGGASGPDGVTATTDTNLFSLVDLATFRQTTPADTPVMQHEATDARSAPVMPPTTLASGEELEAWARFQIGATPLQGGATIWTRSLWIRYSVLGVERTAELALEDGVGIVADCS